MGKPTFWNDQERAKAVIAELKTLNDVLKPFESLVSQSDDLGASSSLAKRLRKVNSTTRSDRRVNAPRKTSTRSSFARCSRVPTTTARLL